MLTTSIPAWSLLTIMWGTMSCSATRHADAFDDNVGCVLEGEAADIALARSTKPQTFSHGNEPLITSSGNRELDYAIAQTLSRLTSTFHALLGFAFYNDAGSRTHTRRP